MKNLFRKLHIGGNHDDEVDAGRIIEGRSFHEGSAGGGSLPREQQFSSVGATISSASSGSPTSLSTSPATSAESKPSGLSTFINAVKDSVGRVKDNEKLHNPLNAIGQLMHRLDSSGGSGGGGGDDSSTAGGKRLLSPPGSFKRGPSPPGSLKRGSPLGSENQKDVPSLKALQNEEDYQVQMAMALSVSGNYQIATVARVVEKAQIEAAKRISLGLSPAAVNSESDTLSYRYWACGTVDYDEAIPDGFYDVFGLNSDSSLSERLPLLSDLQKIPISDASKIEVVLVDRSLDADLKVLEANAAKLADPSAEAENEGSFRTGLAQKLALLVAQQMGGPVGSETDMLLRWQKTSWDLKSSKENVVLNLGSLNIGLTRHRALLFKVLADHVNMPCQLVKGRHYPGVKEEGAVNIIKVDDNREFIIDLMGAPGALIPSDRTVTNSSEADISPKSSKTEHSSSFVSSTQSSPSGSARSTRSDTGVHDKERKDLSIHKGNVAAIEENVSNMKLDGRHHSEPVELQGLDLKPLRHTVSSRPSHFRSPSWTEGIGLPVGRQTKDISKDVSQLMIDAAKENPIFAQKLHNVLLEGGVIPDISPKQLQAQVFDEKKLEDEKRISQDKKIPLSSHPPRKKSSTGSGRPPPSTLKPTLPLTAEGLNFKNRLERLDSVEGMGDRRPLESLPVDLSSQEGLLQVDIRPDLPLAVPAALSLAVPAALPLTVPAALPLAVPAALPLAVPAALPLAVPAALPVAIPITIPLTLPVVTAPPIQSVNSVGFIGHVPVAAAAAAAATAAVVASSMVAAAVRGEGGGDPKMEVPIAAAATATAAVVAATSAVAGKKVDSNESSPVLVDYHQPGNGDRETRFEEHEKGGSSGRYRPSDDRRSEAGGSTPGNSHRAASSGDGLDGEVSVDEERSSEDMAGSLQRRYDAVLGDVAEWEIPWEDIVIGERIGLGSYGEVYRGDWHGSEVAVKKFLDQDLSGYALEEFRSEVRIMRRLRHPNVVLFMGAITRAPHLSIVTEFLPRGSLYRLIHRPNSQLDERRRLRMALDVAKGMNYLHSGNPVIVHRDLKSPNLLVDKNWVVKVCDFGLSRMKHNTFLSSKSTAGTPEWMAPEMLRNEPSNEKCDVYSFGVILWELATLQQPWAGMNPMQVVGAVGFQYRRLDIPPEMDPGLARIIRECWHDNPNLRPSFSQLMAALRPLQRPLSAAQQAVTSRLGQTSQGSTIQSQPQEQPPPQESAAS